MAGAEPWDRAPEARPTGPATNPYTDPSRATFWAPTVINMCPECRHPTESHRLREIAVDRRGARAPRVSARVVYEVECLVCARQCCRAYS